MAYSQYVSYRPSITDRQSYLDQRYDRSSLGFQIPSLRQSVHHTRENARNPAAPRAYVNPNGVLPPLSFRLATECHPTDISVNAYNPFYRNSRMAYRISSFRILARSEETAEEILRHLSYTDLAALALVDKDFCQLVRTRLFRSVWLNFSNTSMALLMALVDEGCARYRAPGVRRNRWRLGACIRRITICTNSGANKSTDWAARSWVEERVSNIAAIELHGRHMNALELVLRIAVPNLEFLDWRDRIQFTPLMASAISHSPITRLELHHIELREDFSLQIRPFQKQWHLRSVLLCVSIAGHSGLMADNFITSIFRLSAPTLEELVWEGTSDYAKYTIGTSELCFTKLQKLQLRGIRATDEALWESLIPGNEESALTDLSMECCYSDLASFLGRRGHIPTLTHLSWLNIRPESNPDCIAFLSANHQLESCRYDEPYELNYNNDPPADPPPGGLQSLVPIFSSSSFHLLTSLSVVWSTPTIPAPALRGIGTLTALKHLYLSAGMAFREKIDWRVDHKSLRKRLRPLKQLKWLVLTRDAYAHGNEPLWGFDKPQPGMEIRHRDDMMRYARLFAMVLPELEWAYFGGVPMAVERGTGQELMVVPLAEQGDLCLLLRDMWGDRMSKWGSR